MLVIGILSVIPDDTSLEKLRWAWPESQVVEIKSEIRRNVARDVNISLI